MVANQTPFSLFNRPIGDCSKSVKSAAILPELASGTAFSSKAASTEKAETCRMGFSMPALLFGPAFRAAVSIRGPIKCLEALAGATLELCTPQGKSICAAILKRLKQLGPPPLSVEFLTKCLIRTPAGRRRSNFTLMQAVKASSRWPAKHVVFLIGCGINIHFE